MFDEVVEFAISQHFDTCRSNLIRKARRNLGNITGDSRSVVCNTSWVAVERLN
jgi:hypothetical protein